MQRKIATLLAIIVLLTALSILFVNECSSVGGMGWSVVKCECTGIQRILYDRTEVDGPMRSICIGVVQSRTCFQYVDGPRIECNQ